jgi:hypothetical protein
MRRDCHKMRAIHHGKSTHVQIISFASESHFADLFSIRRLSTVITSVVTCTNDDSFLILTVDKPLPIWKPFDGCAPYSFARGNSYKHSFLLYCVTGVHATIRGHSIGVSCFHCGSTAWIHRDAMRLCMRNLGLNALSCNPTHNSMMT